MYIEKDSVRFFFLPVEAAFFLDGVFFGGIVEGGWGLVEVLCVFGVGGTGLSGAAGSAPAAEICAFEQADFFIVRSRTGDGRTVNCPASCF